MSKQPIDTLAAESKDLVLLEAINEEKLRHIDRFAKINLLADKLIDHLDAEERRIVDVISELAGNWANQLCEEQDEISYRIPKVKEAI